MKIAIVIDNLASGGAEKQSVIAAATLGQLGQQVELISYGRNNDFTNFINRKNINLVHIKARGRLRIARLCALVRHLRKKQFDVVHTFKGAANIYGRIAAKLAGVPCIFAGCRGPIDESFLLRILNRVLTCNTAGWIVNANSLKEFVSRHFNVKKDNIYVAQNAIEVHDFQSILSKQRARAKFGVPRDTLVVSIISNLRPIKNHEMFLRVAQKVTNSGIPAIFVAAGQGPLQNRLEDLAATIGIRDSVRFIGSCKNIPDLLKASDVVVLTSLKEGLPNALLEAGAAGLPCVSTACGDTSEVIVDGKTGFVVPVDDDAAMVECLIHLLKDRTLRERMGQTAKSHISKEFHPVALGNKLLSIYRSCSGQDK